MMSWSAICSTVLIFFVIVAEASIPIKGCPKPCRCDSRKNVYCQNKELTYVPFGIPKNTVNLHLQDNKISNSQDLEDILSKLPNLVRLNLANNTLTAFPRNLPRSLESISINSNKIRYIATDVFDGLSNLKTLYLDNNLLTEKGMLSTSFQGANNLVRLTLTSNQLTEVPVGIPPSVTILRLDKNKISAISRDSLSDLVNLQDLDMRYNELNMDSFNNDVFSNLISLETLDLGFNRFEELPKQLPENVRNLLMPSNNIKYIYTESNDEHGSLRYLSQLSKLDLSNNTLKSVESGAFSGLERLSKVILHNNPWQCDCYLRYLKNWLGSELIVNQESNVKCATPNEIKDVTLDSLDIESMLCFPEQKPNIVVSNSSPGNIEMSWSIHDGTTPPYAKYRVMFGEMKCGNCSDYPLEDSTWKENNKASALVVSYQIIPVDQSMTNGDFVSVNLPNVIEDTSYMACLLYSFEDARELKAQSCKFIRKQVQTTPVSQSPDNLSDSTVPIWIMVIVMSAIVVILAIVIALIVKKKLAMKSKLKRTHTANGGGSYYDPFSHTYLRPEPFLPQPPAPRGGPQHYHENERLMSRTSDATKEFDVTLMIRPDPNNPNLLRPHQGGSSPETCAESCCSDFQNATISTNNTRTATASMGSGMAEIDENSLSREECSFPYSITSNSHFPSTERDDEYIYHTIASNICAHSVEAAV